MLVMALPMTMRSPSYPSPNTPTSSTGWSFPEVKKATGMAHRPRRTLLMVNEAGDESTGKSDSLDTGDGGVGYSNVGQFSLVFLRVQNNLLRLIPWGSYPSLQGDVHEEHPRVECTGTRVGATEGSLLEKQTK